MIMFRIHLQTFLSRPSGISLCIPNLRSIRNSASEGGFLGIVRTMVLTVSLSCLTICSRRRWEEIFSFLKIMLFLSFQTVHIMKLGVKAQAEPRS